MKVSIVTISFNQAQFLEAAINSVLNQDYDNLEYIVVDPGSTDGSREILEKYSSKITTLILEPDMGPADGLNKGFCIANGEIYGFLNSDDVFLPNAIKEAVGYFKAYPDVDMVSGHCFTIDENGSRLRRAYSDRVSLLAYAFNACVQVQPSTFFRAAAYTKAGGFNKDNRVCWDGELFIDITLNGGKSKIVKNFWSEYRLHSESITCTPKMDRARKQELIRIFKKITGRNERASDMFFKLVYRLYKHMANPFALYERITKGPFVTKKQK